MPLLLGVNIDHVATLRQARYAGTEWAHNAEPSPLDAAHDAMAGGADSITVHVRGDRRHMQEADVIRIRAEVPVATTRPARTANASAIENCGSTVSTLPPTNTASGGGSAANKLTSAKRNSGVRKRGVLMGAGGETSGKRERRNVREEAPRAKSRTANPRPCHVGAHRNEAV